jgi:tetraacyldisaccharide 4'-kinase
MNWLVKSWYQPHPIRWLLTPLSALYRIIIFIRKKAYEHGFFKQFHAGVPTIIVGNITVGGTGKTPFVIWLAQHLQAEGYSPGIISRGYGGKTNTTPQIVSPDSDPALCGDEPILIAKQTACPVVVSADRQASVKQLLSQNNCNVIIADDGLQHYRLQRDIEIVIVDASRQFGNGYCLPAGPLREPISRLKQVDYTVFNGDSNMPYTMQLSHKIAINLYTQQQKSIDAFSDISVHAVAGIGNPQRFFTQLKQHNIKVVEHPFNDHHPYIAADLAFDDQHPILMTEKDAVKCQSFATEQMWFIATETSVTKSLFAAIEQQIRNTQSG